MRQLCSTSTSTVSPGVNGATSYMRARMNDLIGAHEGSDDHCFQGVWASWEDAAAKEYPLARAATATLVKPPRRDHAFS